MKHVRAFLSSGRGIVLVFATALWALVPSAARATPVNYVFSPGSFVVLGDQTASPLCSTDPTCAAAYAGFGADEEAISGSFTYDASTETVSDASVTLTGASPFSGTFSSLAPSISSGFPLILTEAGQDPTDPANTEGGASLSIFLPGLPNGTAAMNVQQINFESEFPGAGNVTVTSATSANFLSASIEPEPISDFALIESGGTCPMVPALPIGILNAGCFTIINNTTDYNITGFEVGNIDALFDATTRSNWDATLTSADYGSGPEQSFGYFDLGGSGANPLGNGSDDSFFFSTTLLGSPFTVFANGPNGPVSCTGTSGGGCDPPVGVPEPGTLSLIGVGLLMMGALRWRNARILLFRDAGH